MARDFPRLSLSLSLALAGARVSRDHPGDLAVCAPAAQPRGGSHPVCLEDAHGKEGVSSRHMRRRLDAAAVPQVGCYIYAVPVLS